MSGAERSHARAGAWAYLAGVVLSFAGLGGTLAAARAAGSAAGWGFQFQSPAFVAAIALVLFAIGLNLSGVFSIVGGGVAGGGDRGRPGGTALGAARHLHADGGRPGAALRAARRGPRRRPPAAPARPV